MKSFLSFPIRAKILLYFLCAISFNVYCQSPIETENSITLVNSILNDGSKIWGILQKEDDFEILVFDFNLGEIKILKKNIESLEKEKIESAVIIETENNFSYFGFIVGVSSKSLVMKTKLLDTINIQSNTISKITLSDEFVNKNGKNWFSNPNDTRYFFAPSAIPLKKKEGYYQNAYLLANSVSFGLTDKITIGGGVVIPLLFYITPKISYQVNKKLYVGAGILFTQSFISTFNLSAGIGYGLITAGNREHNLTLGLGYGYAKFDTTYRATPMPIITINGMTRIRKRLSLVTENWLIPRANYNIEHTAYEPNGMPYTESISVKKDFYTLATSLGLRVMPNIKTSIDFSVVGIRANPNSNYIFIPYLDFVYKF